MREDGVVRKIGRASEAKQCWSIFFAHPYLSGRLLLCGSLSGVRSCCSRMGMLCRGEQWHRLVVMLPDSEVSSQGVVQECGETRLRTRSIENLRSELPRVSRTDLASFLRGS